MFVYQPIFNMLELRKDKDTDYVIGWKSKGLFESKFFPWHGAFLPNIKYIGYKIVVQFSFSYRTKQLHDHNCQCLHCLQFR